MNPDKKSNRKNKRERSKDRKFFKSYSHEIFFVSVLLACISLFSVVIVLTNEYTKVLNEQVESKAALYSVDAVKELSYQLDDLVIKSQLLGNKILESQTKQKLDSESILTINENQSSQLTDIVYCINSKVFTIDEEEFQSTSVNKIIEASSIKEAHIIGIVLDSTSTADRPKEFLAISVPSDGTIVDSLVFLYSRDVLRTFTSNIQEKYVEQTSFMSLCENDGVNITTIKDTESFFEQNVDLINGLRKITGGKTNADNLEHYLYSENGGAFTISIKAEKYAVVVAKDKNFKDFSFVCLFNSENLYASGYNFINTILTAIVTLLIFLAVFALYFIISKYSVNRTISNYGTINDQLKCYTALGFEREAAKSLEHYRGSQFAVIVIQIRRFEYISDLVGKDIALGLLQNFCHILKVNLKIGETYGYADNGEFLMLLQYGKIESLTLRLKQLSRLIYNTLSTSKYSLRLNFGICQAERGGKDVQQYISNAKFAIEKSGAEKAEGNFTVYDESFRDTILKISDLEVKMDLGIKNHDFKVFYQPKYSVDKECMDGCEALVRWYDPETDTYRQPDSFIPLFEANGFISRLDHYVFEEVCRFIGECVSKGMPIIPISVNVSRWTLLDKDFVDFYVGLKHKNRIPDNFITLEFTESAAYENNVVLSELAKKLRKNGFACSIDDFGTGYSSYNLLKVLEIDEVKLDRFFIEGCLSSERARYIIEGAINMANKLKIKVTQEGVEDLSTFNYLKSIGCNVIQGYYYSRPLNERDFVEFIKMHLRWSEDKIG